MYDFFGGDGFDFGSSGSGTAPWDVPDYGGTDLGTTDVDYSNTGLPGIDYGSPEYSGYSGSDSSVSGGLLGGGASSSSGNWMQTWGPLIGAGLNFAGGVAKGAMTSKQMQEQEQLAEKLYAAQQAIQEQYYQAHGKQLSDAIGNYAQYQKPANSPSALNALNYAQSPANKQPYVVPPFYQGQPNTQFVQQPQGLLSYGF